MDDDRKAAAARTAGPGAAPVSDDFRGALMAVCAAVAFSISAAVIKQLTAELPEPVIALFRGLFATLFLAPVLARRGLDAFATTRPVAHLWRGVLGFGSFLLFIYALRLLPLGDAMALSFTSPFWSILLGAAILGDRLSPRLCAAVAVGFGGVLLIAQPSGDTGLGAALALLSAALTSLAMMAVKRLSSSEPPDRIAFYFTLFGTIVAVLPCLFIWKTPEAHHWPMLVLIGLLFFLGQTCLTRAYTYGTFSRVAPMDFTRLPLSLAIGFVWFGEQPTAWAAAGMALILAASLDLILTARSRRPR